MRRFRILPVLAVAPLVLALGCAPEVTTLEGRSPGTPESPGTAVPFDSPPPVVLHDETGDVDLDPWSFCFGSGCADGMPPTELAQVSSGAVDLDFPLRGWDFTATFKRLGESCARQITVDVGSTGPTAFHLEPAGPAGTWDVDLFGRGPEGDLITTFRWSTPADGVLPGPPTGSAAVLADHDGELDSYGVEIGISDLGPRPAAASATVVVRGADGRSVEIPTRFHRRCHDAGSLWFTAPAEAGRRATEIGPGPFAYEVRLVLDGTTYVGRGTWPDGETEEIAPHVPLTWTPTLPAYTGRP